MSAALEVPRRLVVRARLHVTATGRPLLTRDRRRVNDLELIALPSSLGFVLTVGPTTPVAQVYVALAQRNPDRDLAADLCSITAAGLDGLPRRFTCEGLTVGLWDHSDARACVRGPIALSCFSWMLRQQKAGFYVTLWEADTG